jgi:hypothetical protein
MFFLKQRFFILVLKTNIHRMIRPNTDPLEAQLSRLEQEISNDFNLLHEGGASYFSTEELRDLLLHTRLNINRYQKMHYLSIGFLCAAATSFLVGNAIFRSGFTAYAEKVFYSIPILMALAIITQYRLRKKYRNRETLDNYGMMIQDELLKRRRERNTSYS